MRSRKRQDPIAPYEQSLLKEINTTKPEYLSLYARYFGKAIAPEQIRMTDIDSLGAIFQKFTD